MKRYIRKKSKKETKKEKRCELIPRNFPKEVFASQLSIKNEKIILKSKQEKTTIKEITDIIKILVFADFTTILITNPIYFM